MFEVHPCCGMYQYSISFYCSIVWIIPNFVYPFSRSWSFGLFPFFWLLWIVLSWILHTSLCMDVCFYFSWSVSLEWVLLPFSQLQCAYCKALVVLASPSITGSLAAERAYLGEVLIDLITEEKAHRSDPFRMASSCGKTETARRGAPSLGQISLGPD